MEKRKEFQQFYIQLILIEIINVCEIFNEFLSLFIICIVQILNFINERHVCSANKQTDRGNTLQTCERQARRTELDKHRWKTYKRT